MRAVFTKNFLRLEKEGVCCRARFMCDCCFEPSRGDKISRPYIHKSFIFQEFSILHYCISGLQETKRGVLNPLQRHDSRGKRGRPISKETLHFLWVVAMEVTEVTSKEPSPAAAWRFRFVSWSQIHVTWTPLGWSSERHTDFCWLQSCTAAVCTYLRYGVFWNKMNQISPTAYVSA